MVDTRARAENVRRLNQDFCGAMRKYESRMDALARDVAAAKSVWLASETLRPWTI